METYYENYFITENIPLFIITWVMIILSVCICSLLAFYEIKKNRK